MSITLGSASLPVFIKGLRNLNHCLGKAVANAQARKFDVNVLVQARLAPDMLPLASQVRIACDTAKLGVARLAGIDAPKHADTETTLPEFQARVAATLDYLGTISASQIDGREAMQITFPVGRDGATLTMSGEDYLRYRALPNFYFHITTAYDILRHNGVDLGKADYLSGGG